MCLMYALKTELVVQNTLCTVCLTAPCESDNCGRCIPDPATCDACANSFALRTGACVGKIKLSFFLNILPCLL